MATRQQLAQFAAISLFGSLGIQGLWGAAEQWMDSDTIGKIVQTGSLGMYGLSGLWIAARLLRRQRRLVAVEMAWSAAVVLAAGLAPSAWGDAPLIAGVTSGAGGGAIVAFMLWLLRRGPSLSEAAHTSGHGN